MAPIAISLRLPAVVVGLVAPREAELDSLPPPGLPIAAIARRFHATSKPLVASRTIEIPSLDLPSRMRLHARQTTETVPGNYPELDAGPDPGTVVGIVLGSVGGFLLLLWLVYTCLQIGGRGDTVSSYGTESIVTRKSHRRQSRHHNHHHHRSPARRETVEVRTSRVVPPPERVVVEEQVRRTSSQAPPPPPMPAPPPPRMMTPRIVTDDEEEEVVVIEEHSPPRRHKSRSHRRRSSSARRESGFREVDPDRYAGGDASFREVRRSSRHGR